MQAEYVKKTQLQAIYIYLKFGVFGVNRLKLKQQN